MKFENFDEMRTLIENDKWTKWTREEIKLRISQVPKSAELTVKACLPKEGPAKEHGRNGNVSDWLCLRPGSLVV